MRIALTGRGHACTATPGSAPSQHLMMTIRIRTLTRDASEGRDPSSTTSIAFHTEKGLSPIVGAWVCGI